MEKTALVDAYLEGIERLREAVDGLDVEQLRTRPVAGMWSFQEVVCHLADSEALFAERMKRVLVEERPALLFADPNRYVAALAYEIRDVAEEVAFIASVRRQMARILRVQPAEAWQRVGVHSKEGERTLEQLVRKAVDHLEHHLSILMQKRQSLTDRADFAGQKMPLA